MLTQRARAAAETFTLQLSSAVPAAELRAWFAAAAPGHEATYASGAVLPQAEPGVVLARELAAAGLARTHQKRDPADARRWLFVIVKASVGPTAPLPEGQSPGGEPPDAPARVSPCSRAGALPEDAGRLLELLRDCAEQGRPCPTNGEAGRLLALEPEWQGKGRMRAQYLFALLARAGAIASENRGTCKPRVVTVLAEGRAQGRRTADG